VRDLATDALPILTDLIILAARGAVDNADA
jgi:hypothetical protein